MKADKFWKHIEAAMVLLPEAIKENEKTGRRVGHPLEPVTGHLKKIKKIFQEIEKDSLEN